ncbi:MAG: bifunctional sugar-1-phosphate nucleotidylyltransferase/acetyltransferase [Thermoprotei archaeon]
MEALLLAAGYGRGLEPLTHTRNKVMIPVINKVLLDHHVENLVRIGVNRVVVVVNYMRDQVERRARILAERFSCDVKVVDQGRPLGTGDAVRRGLEEIHSDYFLVVYGDIYVEYNDLKEFVNAGKNLIGAYEVSDPRRYGVLMINDNLVLKDIIEKPEEAPSNLINAGIYLLSSKVRKYLDELQPSPRGEYELTDAVVRLGREESVYVVKLSYWRDLGRPWNLLELNKDLMSSWRDQVIKGEVESGVIIKNPVYVDEGAEVLSGTYIIGPAYVGRGAVVGPNSFIRPYTVILDQAKVGFNVEIKESVVMSKTHVSHHAYVGDSIVGEDCNLGAGTITANLRFDEKPVSYIVKKVREPTNRVKFGAVFGDRVKTGVDVSTMPGVKIGAYSWIYPGAVVTRDVPPCSIYVSEEDVRELKGECMVDKDLWLSS